MAPFRWARQQQQWTLSRECEPHWKFGQGLHQTGVPCECGVRPMAKGRAHGGKPHEDMCQRPCGLGRGADGDNLGSRVQALQKEGEPKHSWWIWLSRWGQETNFPKSQQRCRKWAGLRGWKCGPKIRQGLRRQPPMKVSNLLPKSLQLAWVCQTKHW